MTDTHQPTRMQTPGAGLPVSQDRKWDWRVVVLELVIVFVGLFAALQLDSYRDQQEFRAAQQRYLVRMKEDLAEYLVSTEYVQNFLEYNYKAVSYVSDSLQAGKIPGGDTELFERGVIYFAHLPSNPLPRSAYEEMVASGMFSALESEELKKAISLLFSTHEFTEQNFRWWREGALNFENELASAIEYYDDPGVVLEEGFLQGEPIRRVRYDFSELANNRQVRNGFYWAKDSVNDWLSFTIMLRESAADVEALIEQQLQ
jgi:hypothetical protein